MSRPYIFHILILDDLGPHSMYADLEEELSEAECFSEITWNPASKRDTPCFRAKGEYSLGAGRSSDEEIRRLQRIIWEIVGRYVTIQISAVYLEPDPVVCSESDYEKWIEDGGKPRDRCPCGTLLDDDDEWDGACWRCEDKCRGCGIPLDRKDTEETHCEECKVGAAELRMEDR